MGATDDWVFTDDRFQLLNGADETLVRFLAETVHPAVRPDIAFARELVDAFNEQLRHDNWELVETSQLSGRPIYSGRKRSHFHRPGDAIDTEGHRDLLDPATLQEHLRRIERDLNSDPPGAIASSKELVESVLRAILDHAGVEHRRGLDTIGALQTRPE